MAVDSVVGPPGVPVMLVDSVVGSPGVPAVSVDSVVGPVCVQKRQTSQIRRLRNADKIHTILMHGLTGKVFHYLAPTNGYCNY